MKAGDHLVSPRTGYTHHGIYIGNGEVIHYAGLAGDLSRGRIEITSVSSFSAGKGCSVRHHASRLHSYEESVARASSRLGEDLYSALLNNCEHFVNWCIHGIHWSTQSAVVAGAGAAIATFARGAAPRIAVSAAPAVMKVAASMSPSIAASSNAIAAAGGIGAGIGVSAATTSAATVGIASAVGFTAAAPVLLPALAATAIFVGLRSLLR